MKMLTGVEIKSGRKSKDKERAVVATIDIQQFDTVDEAVRTLSEKEALGLINTQYATNEKNKARASAVGEPSMAALKFEAFSRLGTTVEGQAKLQAVQGNQAQFEALVNETIAQIKKEKGIEDDTEADPNA